MKENDDARVSKEITDILVEHSSVEKAETTEVAEEVADMETVEELKLNDKVESTEVVVQSSVVICSESVKNVCEAGKEFL